MSRKYKRVIAPVSDTNAGCTGVRKKIYQPGAHVVYHETLGEAIEEGYQKASALALWSFDAHLKDDLKRVSETFQPMHRNQTQRHNFQLSRSRAWAHISIYRLESGRYELNVYVS